MDQVKKMLEGRKQQLLSLKREKEGALANAPEGILRVCCSGQRTQYYRRENEKDGNGTYLRKKNRDIICKLAQKEYDQKVLRVVEKELRTIEKCLAEYPTIQAELIYEQLHRERQKLVTPVLETEEQYIRKWESFIYEGKMFEENAPEFYTAKNERVRSKSEWIIADLLNREGIPYRYECPLELKGMGRIYPDFMVLNVKKRKEFYWEHLGLMDDAAYADKALQKIIQYEQNGIYPGDKLIITHETRKNPLSQKQVKIMIEHYLK